MNHPTIRRRAAGLTMIELMIVVAVIGILATVAVPMLIGARQNANEASVLHTLKAIAAAQVEIQVAGEIDVDLNGTGEYGFLGELAGVTDIRADESGGLTAMREAGVFDGVFRRSSVDTQNAAARALPERITPAPLSISFGDITNGRLQRNGYLFQVCLPSSSGVPQSESTFGGAENISVGATQAENYWCCYAWPVKFGQTGKRCFFMNETGQVYSASNSLRYSGHDTAPPELAAYAGANMASGVDAKGTGVDGQSWREGMSATAAADDDEEAGEAEEGAGDSGGSPSKKELNKAKRQANRAANVAKRREKRAAQTKKRAEIAASRAAAAKSKAEKAAATAAAKGDKKSKRLAKRAANQAKAAERAAQNAAKRASKAQAAATAARAQADKLAEKYAAMK